MRGISPSVNLSAVMNDIWRAVGRTGIAAVLGSKKLKTIFVKGKNRPEVVDKESYFSTSRRRIAALLHSPAV